MRPAPDALVERHASIHIAASPDHVYALVSDIERMGEWSPEAVGGVWLDGATGQPGEWFEGHNQRGDREWSRPCQVARAEPGRDFTFVVDGVDANCTWWSYEMQPADEGTTLTERWWVVNKTPGVAAMTPEQFEDRVDLTEQMMHTTLAALKVAAEAV